jgi:hypothetical protein
MLRVGLSNIKGPATSQRLPVHSRQAEKTRCIRPPHLRGGLMPLFVGKPHSSCATGQKLTYSHDHIRRNRSSNLTIHYDGKHIIVFDEHEKVQEGYRRKAWIELAGGIPTGSVFEGVAATKERATELAKEKAVFAITTGTVKYCESNGRPEGTPSD